ncbi:MAG TPA: hypothetical protein VFE37_28390 [Chloroflexota bacterium]|nr:hypothetical protein [Chloroflexota bacterium]
MKRPDAPVILCAALVGLVLLGMACAPPTLLSGAAAPVAATGPSADASVASFYSGKTVRIVVGFAPGGGFDTYSRLMARHLGKYLPGHPNVIVENAPGAASAAAANQVFNTRPKDGTVIGNFNENLVLLQALGAKGIEYDARRFQFLGSLADSPSACAFRADTGIESFADIVGGREATVAADSPGSTSHDVPAVLREALGANLKVVTGYNGTAQSRVAVDRQEVDGACWTWDSMSVTARAWFEASPPTTRVLVVMGSETPPHPWLADTPSALSLAESELARQLILGVSLPSQIGKPLAVAPEVPPERVAALRQAFTQALADPDLKADASKWKLEINAKSAPEVEARVRQILDLAPDAKGRLKEIMGS